MDTIYQITEQLKEDGFSINYIKNLITRNQGNTYFNTLDYFNIFWFPNSSVFVVEGIEYSIEANSFVFIGPGKNICFGKFAHKEKTVGFTFSSTFYEKSANDSFFLNSELFFTSDSNVFILQSVRSREQIKQFIVERLAFYKEKDHGLYISVAHNSIESIILDGLLVLESTHRIQTNKHTYIEIVNRFRVLLQQHYKTQRTIGFYAKQLNVPPRRLSLMAEELLGKSAKQMISEKVINESIRILRYTHLTIAEITYELGFTDEGNFSSFVKKHTGKKPKEIRLEHSEEMKKEKSLKSHF